MLYFYPSFFKATWSDNFYFCCSIGMSPFFIKEVVDGDCFQNFIKGSENDQIFLII